MLEILLYPFFQRALVAGVIIGVTCAVIGVYVVLKGMSFIGSGIAHSAFGGVALGYLLGWNLILSAVLFCLLTALGIGMVSQRGHVREDTAIGIFFTATMALGILFVGMLRGYNVDLFGTLFGSILAVTPADLLLTLILGLLVLLTVALLFKEFLAITFDPEITQVVGLPATALYFVLLVLITLTIVIAIKVVGIVLVSALLITPAAAAYQLSTDFRRMMALSILIGVGSVVGGLLLSYQLNTASGATIVLLATAVFFLALACSPRRRRFRRGRPSQEGRPS